MDAKELKEIKNVLERMGFIHTDSPDDIKTIISVFEAAWVDYKDDGFKISLEEVITYGVELIDALCTALEARQQELARANAWNEQTQKAWDLDIASNEKREVDLRAQRAKAQAEVERLRKVEEEFRGYIPSLSVHGFFETTETELQLSG